MKLIIGFSFGRRDDWPNESSQAIARLIAERVALDRHGYFIIAQWEVAEALLLHRVVCDHVVWSRPEGRGYLRTTDVASAARKYIFDNNLSVPDEILAAAHPDHVERCIICLRYFWLYGAKPLTDPGMVYDPKSTEFWVRSRRRFRTWNAVASALSPTFA